MIRMTRGFLPVLALGFSLAVLPAIADKPTPAEVQPDYKVPLSEDDLRAITLEVLRKHPVLSSSPGIKYADGSRGFNSINGDMISNDLATVIFHPHAESAGIKHAFEVYCVRDHPLGLWTCPGVQIRRYVKLDSQEFEVRVKGNLALAGVQAVIEASRKLAANAVTQGLEIADTAYLVFPCNGGYLVSWGTKEEMGGPTVEAKLREGGDPANPNDWKTRLLPES